MSSGSIVIDVPLAPEELLQLQLQDNTVATCRAFIVDTQVKIAELTEKSDNAVKMLREENAKYHQLVRALALRCGIDLDRPDSGHWRFDLTTQKFTRTA